MTNATSSRFTSIAQELQSFKTTSLHLLAKRSQGKTPSANADPLLIATFGSVSICRYFDVISPVPSVSAATRYAQTKCLRALIAAFCTS
jgi:hypothetical protein